MEFVQYALFPFESIAKGSKVVLYGGGDVGQAFFHQINRRKYCELVGWIDKEWSVGEKREYPYIRIGDLKGLQYDKVIIAVNNAEIAGEIEKLLISTGVKEEKIVYFDDYLLRYTVRKIRGMNAIPEIEKSDLTENRKTEQKKIGIGLMAVSAIAQTIAQTILDRLPEVRLRAVASRTLDKAQKFADRFGIERAYGSYEEMLADDEVNLVYVSSPASFHYEHVMLCLKYGKHVLCEKPFAMNAAQAGEMLQFAREKGCFISDGLWTAYLPMVYKISQIVKSGMIGKVSTLCANQHYYAGVGGRLRDKELGGSVVLEMGVYLLSFAQIVFQKPVKEIYAAGVVNADKIDEQTAVILRFDDEIAVLSCGMNAQSDRMGGIYGSQGYILMQDANEYKRMQVYDSKGTLISEVNMSSGYEYEIRACVQAILEGRIETEERSHEIILSSMQMTDMIRAKMGIQ